MLFSVDAGRSVDTIEQLVAGATDRRPVRSSDAKSGGTFELMSIEGRPCFLKVLDVDSDWIMRVTGNTDHWEYKVWRAGLYHRFPDVIDHTIIAMALDTTGGDVPLFFGQSLRRLNPPCLTRSHGISRGLIGQHDER